MMLVGDKKANGTKKHKIKWRRLNLKAIKNVYKMINLH